MEDKTTRWSNLYVVISNYKWHGNINFVYFFVDIYTQDLYFQSRPADLRLRREGLDDIRRDDLENTRAMATKELCHMNRKYQYKIHRNTRIRTKCTLAF